MKHPKSKPLLGKPENVMTKREERVNSQNGGIEQWCTRGEGSKQQKAKVEGGERESCWEFATISDVRDSKGVSK